MALPFSLCHPEGGEAESKDLPRHRWIRRSLDSLAFARDDKGGGGVPPPYNII